MLKKILSVMIVIVLVVSLSACGSSNHTYTFEDMSISLPDNFVENEETVEEVLRQYEKTQTDDFIIRSVHCLEADDIGVVVTQYTVLVPSDLNFFKDAARDGHIQAGYSASESKKEDDFLYFTVDCGKLIDDTDFSKMVVCFGTDEESLTDAKYWTVQFFCPSDSFEDNQSRFLSWAKSITVRENND